jgi:DNA-binding NarL/FixJ family response regulator
MSKQTYSAEHPSYLSEPWYLKIHDLMPYRVREILLVSSPYDAFTLEEDGRLTESIFTRYSELNLSSAPRITHVSTGARALELLSTRRFDLVISMVRIADTDVSAFGRTIKERWPNLPVVLLMLNEADLKNFPGGVDSKAVDKVWVWTGDARMLFSIIKSIEDEFNVEHDTKSAGVRVIIVVEDSVRRYCSFLSLLYAEIMAQSESLIAEGVNDLHRLMRMQTRPKILLATNYEEAIGYYRRFHDYVLAVISDVRFPKNGEEDPNAGFDFVRMIRSEDPELPILMQSAEPENAVKAAELGVHYADKSSNTLLRQIQRFVVESLGFGDFVFRLPDRTEVARVRDMYELEEAIRWVPAESLGYHGARNHFSLWLLARSMFRLADMLRPQEIESLGGVENMRQFLLKTLHEARIREQEGVITDFSAKQFIAESHFIRLRGGSIGGKARGLAFVSSLLTQYGLNKMFPELGIQTARSIVIGTEEFDHFIEHNRILEGWSQGYDDQLMLNRCLDGRLSDSLLWDLRRVIADFHGPLAVRSSSLLEDAQLQPFAGIYATYMLPNNHPDPEVRFNELCRAIKAVYASTFSEDARAYMAGTPYTIEEEKMGVLIQEIVGRDYGGAFYPAISGVALSYNYYPIGHQKAEDGIVMLALGLGRTIVQGGTALQFSPANPAVLPQFATTGDVLKYSQATFYALDTTKQHIHFDARESGDASLKLFELDRAEQDGVLSLVGSVYNRQDDVIRDNLREPGLRVVTFNNVLKWNAIPLAAALRELLWRLRDGLGYAVEMEFAVNMGDREQPPCLYVLQVRPQAMQLLDSIVEPENFPIEQVLCKTDRSLGHGVVEGVQDIVFVKRSNLESWDTPGIAEEVGFMNERLSSQKTPYLLVGPGRWGSSDQRLGIPVKWSQIAGARVIIETNFLDREVEPSQGAHFFHNVASFGIGYLTLSNMDRQATAAKRFCDRAWLEQLPAVFETNEVKHVRLEKPLRIFLDGKKGSATILKA